MTTNTRTDARADIPAKGRDDGHIVFAPAIRTCPKGWEPALRGRDLPYHEVVRPIKFLTLNCSLTTIEFKGYPTFPDCARCTFDAVACRSTRRHADVIDRFAGPFIVPHRVAIRPAMGKWANGAAGAVSCNEGSGPRPHFQIARPPRPDARQPRISTRGPVNIKRGDWSLLHAMFIS